MTETVEITEDVIMQSENDGYLTINDGSQYCGVVYRINDISFIESDGDSFIKFDYDVQGLDEKDSKEFEAYLGNIIKKGLEDLIKEDTNGD